MASGQTHAMRSLVLYEPPLELEELASELRDLFERAERPGDYEAVTRGFLQRLEVDPEQETLLRSMPAVWNALLDGARTVRREVEALVGVGFDAKTVDVDVPAYVLVGSDTSSSLFLSQLDQLCDRLGTTPRQIPGQRHLANVFAPPLLAAQIRCCLQS